MTSKFPLLVLGSTSRYRRELLQRLRLPFTCVTPEVDERPRQGEPPAALATRLAIEKAQDAARRALPDAGPLPALLVIGSDQVAELDGQPIGKPGSHERAREQLRSLSGRSVVFHTAVCVWSSTGEPPGVALVSVPVRFRSLSDREIETYLLLDQPYDCAGSAKCETLGISLLDAIESDDPTALIGLPLIATTRLLREAGLDVLAFHAAQRETSA